MTDNSVRSRQEGMFGLREWEEEGFMPQPQDMDDPNYGQAPVRKARQPSARVCLQVIQFKVIHLQVIQLKVIHLLSHTPSSHTLEAMHRTHNSQLYSSQS